MTEYQPDQLPPEFHEQPLTARMLDDFATCPRKFLLSFFTTRDAERHFRGGSAALHQAVRAAVLDLYASATPGPASLQSLLDGFEAYWDGSLCVDALEEEQLHAQGQRMLRDYHEDHAGDAARVLATDVRLEGMLGEQRFVAVADLILSPERRRVEYQRLVTSRSPMGSAELAKDISAQLLWLLAHDQPVDESVEVTVSYHALRKRKTYEVILTTEEAQQVRREIVSRVARIHRETAFTPQKGKYCRWCRSRARCPAWH